MRPPIHSALPVAHTLSGIGHACEEPETEGGNDANSQHPRCFLCHACNLCFQLFLHCFVHLRTQMHAVSPAGRRPGLNKRNTALKPEAIGSLKDY